MLKIDDLFQHPELIPSVAGWIYEEFWSEKDEYSAADLEGLLRNAVSAEAIPASLIAFVDGQPVGTVNLIENDDEKRPHLRPWLAASLVVDEYRHQGVGSYFVQKYQCSCCKTG